MYKYAIVRQPTQSMILGISSANLGTPIYELALEQHHFYVSILKKCGLSIIELPKEEKYPDACFVEDIAVVNDKVAIITLPGVLSRQGEINNIASYLESYIKNIEQIQPPGTLEGGDVLKVENHYYIGISERTNEHGARQLKQILENYGFSSSFIHLNKFLHLKTGVNYLRNNTVIVAGEFITHHTFTQFNRITIDENDEYAANSLWINDYILTPTGFPNVFRKLSTLNLPILEIPLKEFQKLNGGLSCLSLRF